MTNEPYHGQQQKLPIHYVGLNVDPAEMELHLLTEASSMLEGWVHQVYTLMQETGLTAQEWLEFLNGRQMTVEHVLTPMFSFIEQAALDFLGADRMVELQGEIAQQRIARIERRMQEGL